MLGQLAHPPGEPVRGHNRPSRGPLGNPRRVRDALAAAGVPLAFIDARECRLPNVITLPACPACPAVLGAAAAFLAGLLAGFVLAAVAGLGLLLAGKATRRSQLPLGPFLIAATLGVALAVGIPG